MRYDNLSAVEYAKKYALNSNSNYNFIDPKNDGIGDDCTNFISQCLYAGTCPMVYSPTPWFYKTLISKPYYTASVSWSVAHSLYWFLKTNEERHGYGPKGSEIKDLSLLNLGDLIFFADLNNHIFHSSIITDFAPTGEPLISQHSYNKLNAPIKPEYYNLHIHYLNIYL